MMLSKYLPAVAWLLLLVCSLLTADDPPDDTRPKSDLCGDPLPAGAVARYGTVRLHHARSVARVAFVSGGKLLASGGEDGTVRLWDPADGREVRRWVAPGGQALAVSRDGRILAVGGGRDGRVCLYDVASGEASRQLKTRDSVLSVALSPDGKTLVCGTCRADTRTRGGRPVPGRAGVMVWDVGTGRELRRLAGPDLVGIRSAALSGDGKVFAVLSSKDGQVHLWDVPTGKEHLRFAVPGTGAVLMALSSRGKTLAVASQGKEPIRLYSTATGKEMLRLQPDQEVRPTQGGFSAGPSFLVFSSDGKTLAVATRGVVHLWERASGQEVCRLEGQQGPISSVAFSPDGRLLASGGSDATILVWDVAGLRKSRAR